MTRAPEFRRSDRLRFPLVLWESHMVIDLDVRPAGY